MSIDLPSNQAEFAQLAESTPGMPAIDGFQLLGVLGVGGMSTVYKGHQMTLDRLVAIKVISRQLMHDRAFIQRFLTEARLASKLEHPNIATVLACGTTEDQPYLVMDLLAGKTLKQLLAESEKSSLNLKQIKEIFVPICAGLAHAHAHGIVHRDLKPANVMLVEQDGATVVKVLDFGIAKVMQEENNCSQRLTRTGQVIGSPAYMSPEQFSDGVVDARSDIYSLGCMLFESIVGVPPFMADNPLRLAQMHAMDSVPLTDVSIAIRGVIGKALAKRPEDRFATVQELCEALESIDDKASIVRRRLLPTVRTALRKLPTPPLYISVSLILILIACFVPWKAVAPHDQRLTKAENLIKSGNFVEAYHILKSLQNAVLSQTDADAWLADLINVAIMAKEDVTPNEKFGLHDQGYAAQRITEMAAEPNQNSPSTGMYDQAIMAELLYEPGWAARNNKLKSLPLREADFPTYEYCLSIHDQVCADVLASDKPPKLSEAVGYFSQAIDHARHSGDTGRVLACWLAEADTYFKHRSPREARDCIDQAYAVMDAGVHSCNLETGAALVRLAAMSVDISTAFYNEKRAENAMKLARKIYATTGSSVHARARLNIVEGCLDLNRGKFQAAFACFSEALTSKPPDDDQWDATVGQALSLDRLGNRKDAIAVLENLERLFEKIHWQFSKRRGMYLYSPLILGNLYADEGRNADALRIYEEWLHQYTPRQRSHWAAKQADLNYFRLNPH